MTVLLVFACLPACGNVSGLRSSGDGSADTFGTFETGGAGGPGGAGGKGGVGPSGPAGLGGDPVDGSARDSVTSGDTGTHVDAGVTGLLGSYYASPRGDAYMTRIDPVVDFDPGPSNLQPEEVIWMGEMLVDGTQAVEIEANDDDQVSLTIGGQSAGAGALGLTGVRTDLANLSGWQPLTVEIVRTDYSMSFKAVLIRQQLPADGAPSPVEPAPTEVLKPE
jgi:hypothetical protein